MGQTQPHVWFIFVLFTDKYICIHLTVNEKSVDGVLEI